MPIPLIVWGAIAVGTAVLAGSGCIPLTGSGNDNNNDVDPVDDPPDTGDDDTGDPLPGPEYDKDADGYVDGSLPSEDLQALVDDGTVTATDILPENLDCDDTHFYTNPGIEMEYMGSRDNNCDGSKALVLSRDTVELVPSYDGVQAGYGALAMGDVDGDGIDDALIGSPNEEAAYLVFGPINPGDSTSEMMARADVVINSFEEGWFKYVGTSVAIKNLDGDTDGAADGKGLSEVVIGVPGFNGTGLEQYGVGNDSGSGGILVLHGRSRSDWISDYEAGKFDLTYAILESSSQVASRDAGFLVGGENAMLGAYMTVSDDIDGDDIPEILSNGGSAGVANFAALDPDTSELWSGVVQENQALTHGWLAGQFGIIGTSPITVGDFNGDGLMDPVFGDVNANDGRGAVYVFFGDENLPQVDEGDYITISDTDVDTPTDHFVFTGHEEGFAAGSNTGAADFLKPDTDDIDGDGNRTEMVAGQDGLDDLLARVGGEDVDGVDGGVVYAVPGSGIVDLSSGSVRYFNGDVMDMGGLAYYADESNSSIGTGLWANENGLVLGASSYGDNLNGLVGFVAGSYLIDQSGNYNPVGDGESYPYLEQTVGENIPDDGYDYGDGRLGGYIAGGGDLNHDGAEDFLINDADRQGGTVYVAFGEPPNPAQ